MPASEQTWRDMKLMHRLFGISSVAMLITTIWVFAKDQRREWRTTQSKVVDVDTTMIQWRQQQFETNEAVSVHERAELVRMETEAAPVEAESLLAFQQQVSKLQAAMTALDDEAPTFDQEKAEQLRSKQAKSSAEAMMRLQDANKAKAEAVALQLKADEMHAAAKNADDATAAAAKKAADDARAVAQKTEADALESVKQAGKERRDLLAFLQKTVDDVRRREDVALNRRKFKSAELDAARANIDIGVRDSVPPERAAELQRKVDEINAEMAKLSENYQQKNAARVALQKIVVNLNAPQLQAAKLVEASRADLVRMQDQYKNRVEPYFTNTFPYLGKGLLNLPILNAFNPPQKIENLWSDGLVQDYNFRKVRRFDRCTTCHQLIQRALPGSPLDPAYIEEDSLVMWVSPPEKEATKEDEDLTDRLEKTFGIRLANQGLVNFDDVTVSLVLPNSAGAKAQLEADSLRSTPQTAEQLKLMVAAYAETTEKEQDRKILPGLLVGDVITNIGEDKVYTAESVASRLLDAVGSKKPVKVTVRRGLPNPFVTHPRLDLFVGDSSPHPMGTFGCTICHDGQGSATEFKWASHMPNDDESNPNQSDEWSKKHGWFDNHHWIYPMNPKRFAESGCVKCHHDMTELEPSERFPDPPAPKVTHGYHLLRKYGCYGCHEVNGYDTPSKRIGPDMRLEPNFFAAAQQIGHLIPPRLTELEQVSAKLEASTEASAAEERREVDSMIGMLRSAIDLAQQLAQKSYDDGVRGELRKLLDVEAAKPAGKHGATFPSEASKLSSLLKDVEVEGRLRKPGPTLRYVKEKLDDAFVYDWTDNPRSFRPSTRMPRFFGLWNHLDEEPKGKAVAQKFEPVELHGVVTYLSKESQSFVPLTRAEDISESTVEEKRTRGKELFETRGCLACHNHHDFERAENFRGKNEIVQGPELSSLAAKFDPKRNPKGKDWLYSWIKEPTRYHVRTLMPNLFLDPIETKDAEGKVVGRTDPVDDIVEYLMDPSHLEKPGHKEWKPEAEATKPVDPEALKGLVIEYLRETFHESRLEEYYNEGLPERLRKEVKAAERDLIVAEGEKPTDEQRLRYIGRKTIAKFGCYGCHDIPGFEDAKPIGTGLADWGRKDPAKLAFEHITHYIEHGHGHAGGHHGAEHAAEHASDKITEADHAHDKSDAKHAEHPEEHSHDANSSHAAGDKEKMPVYFERALHHGNRAGFLYQKLTEPRSYDYRKTENKKYNDRLRMPQFPFNVEEREAVITFVLGLVAEPPGEKYLYKPSPRQAAVIAGKQMLENYNCGGCHILNVEKWKLSFPPEHFGEQSPTKTFPFMLQQYAPDQKAASAKADTRGLVHSEVQGLPALTAGDAEPQITDAAGDELEDEVKYRPDDVTYGLEMYAPTLLAGQPFQTGLQALQIPGALADRRYASEGGFLTKYLAPVVLQIEKRSNAAAKGNEAMGWLPPPLVGQGAKVQTAWLHDFLLAPYPIRPAVFLRMPKFNMSPEDSAKIVNYFAAVDNVDYPYEFSARRQADRIRQSEDSYQAALKKDGKESDTRNRFDDAMKIVTNGNYCVKCHLVGDFVPVGSDRAKAPNLAKVSNRLRPEYTRRWIANPKMILPYTAMPVNVPYDPEAEHLGGVSQDLYHGTSVDQVDGLVDLLMNYDEYARRQTRIQPLVEKQAPPPADATPNAEKEAKPEDEAKPEGEAK